MDEEKEYYLKNIFNWNIQDLKKEEQEKIKAIKDEYDNKIFDRIKAKIEPQLVGKLIYKIGLDMGYKFIDETATVKEIISIDKVLCVKQDGTEAIYNIGELVVNCIYKVEE